MITVLECRLWMSVLYILFIIFDYKNNLRPFNTCWFLVIVLLLFLCGLRSFNYLHHDNFIANTNESKEIYKKKEVRNVEGFFCPAGQRYCFVLSADNYTAAATGWQMTPNLKRFAWPPRCSVFFSHVLACCSEASERTHSLCLHQGLGPSMFTPSHAQPLYFLTAGSLSHLWDQLRCDKHHSTSVEPFVLSLKQIYFFYSRMV